MVDRTFTFSVHFLISLGKFVHFSFKHDLEDFSSFFDEYIFQCEIFFAKIFINSSNYFGEWVKHENFEQLTKWLYQITESGRTRIGDNRNLRLLNKILQNEEAKKAFIEDGKSITEAAELTDLSDDNIRYYLNEANANLNEAQKLIHKAKNPTKKDENLLEEIVSSAELIASHLKKTIRQNKFKTQTTEE